MKNILFFAAMITLIFSLVTCAERKKKNEEKESLKKDVDEFVDYATGKTPIDMYRRSKKQTIQISIQQAVNIFESQLGRTPQNLNELVDQGILAKEYTKDEWGRTLSSGQKNGRLYVRSLGRDGESGTADDWEKMF